MFSRLGVLATGHRRLILLLTLAFCVLAGGFGASVGSKLSAGGYTVPSSESSRASQVLADQFHTGRPNLAILVSTPHGADDAATARRGTDLTDKLADEPGVASVWSYWSLGDKPSLRSNSGDSAMVLAFISGNEDQVATRLDALLPHYSHGFQGLQLTFGGQAEAYREMNDQTQQDLAVAETLILPITLLLLIIVFRGVIAALLPLALGVVAIVGALMVLRILVALTNVSVFAENLTTGLGLGLGIDYSLFIVSRFREELAAGQDVAGAIDASLRTAGRTVLFSSLTVALSLSAMLLFPMYFLRSFAYAGIAVVAFAAAAALVVLPALLAALGTRVNTWSLRRRPPKPVEQGFWHRLATVVMRRPIPMATAVIVILLVLGAPFLHIKFSLADARVLPTSAASHRLSDVVERDYSAQEGEPVLVVADRIGDPRADSARIADYASTLSRLPNVARVDSLTGSYASGRQVAPPGPGSAQYGATEGTWLSVVPTVNPYSSAAQDLVRSIRDGATPFDVQVTGEAASFRDTMDGLASRLPWALVIIAVSLFVLLFLLTGSVFLPVKALVLNLLSLSATFGAMVWVFQEGHLRDLLGGFTVTNSITATIPILMFCVAFGLSMDYEIFLLSRIKEEYDLTGHNTESVARGLERTGRLVTAAALLVAVVFLSFVTSGISYLKLLGLGLGLAVLMDATLIRGVLVPAFMRLAGRVNWWAPRPMVRLHRRLGLRESSAAMSSPAPPAPPAPAQYP